MLMLLYKSNLAVFVIASVCLGVSLQAQELEVQRARTDALNAPAGKMVGEVLDASTGLHVYRGIPFAKPPIGELRWRPPQPLGVWEGVRDCLENGSQSVQTWQGRAYGNEDCLYLNVWTRCAGKSDTKLPVKA